MESILRPWWSVTICLHVPTYVYHAPLAYEKFPIQYQWIQQSDKLNNKNCSWTFLCIIHNYQGRDSKVRKRHSSSHLGSSRSGGQVWHKCAQVTQCILETMSYFRAFDAPSENGQLFPVFFQWKIAKIWWSSCDSKQTLTLRQASEESACFLLSLFCDD